MLNSPMALPQVVGGALKAGKSIVYIIDNVLNTLIAPPQVQGGHYVWWLHACMGRKCGQKCGQKCGSRLGPFLTWQGGPCSANQLIFVSQDLFVVEDWPSRGHRKERKRKTTGPRDRVFKSGPHFEHHQGLFCVG